MLICICSIIIIVLRALKYACMAVLSLVSITLFEFYDSLVELLACTLCFCNAMNFMSLHHKQKTWSRMKPKISSP